MRKIHSAIYLLYASRLGISQTLNLNQTQTSVHHFLHNNIILNVLLPCFQILQPHSSKKVNSNGLIAKKAECTFCSDQKTQHSLKPHVELSLALLHFLLCSNPSKMYIISKKSMYRVAY